MWLQLFRLARGGLTTILVAKGLDIGTDGAGHDLTAYASVFGAAGLSALLTVWLSFVIHRRSSAPASTRPIRARDVLELRVPAESDQARKLEDDAKRGCRHVHAELGANHKRLDDALSNGYWWNVAIEGLQTAEWRSAKDAIAGAAPKTYDEVAPVYVFIDDMNAKVNDHHQGGRDDFSEKAAAEMRSLRSRIATAQRKLRVYFR